MAAARADAWRDRRRRLPRRSAGALRPRRRTGRFTPANCRACSTRSPRARHVREPARVFRHAGLTRSCRFSPRPPASVRRRRGGPRVLIDSRHDGIEARATVVPAREEPAADGALDRSACDRRPGSSRIWRCHRDETIRPRGVLLFSYARLKLQLAIEGFDARFFAYDWRLGIDELGAALAAAIAAGKPAMLIAHSMGASGRARRNEAPAEALRAPAHHAGRPEPGLLAPVLALRGTYPFVQKALAARPRAFARLSRARGVFAPSPGSITCCRRSVPRSRIDLLDPRVWPSAGPKPDATLLARVAAARAQMAEPDARMMHIVGVNRQTVVSVRRTPTGFEYGSSANGDGTVPLAMAYLPGLKTYFAEESHGNLASNPRIIERDPRSAAAWTHPALKRRFVPRRGRLSAHRRCAAARRSSAKIDWRRSIRRARGGDGDLDGPSAKPALVASRTLTADSRSRFLRRSTLNSLSFPCVFADYFTYSPDRTRQTVDSRELSGHECPNSSRRKFESRRTQPRFDAQFIEEHKLIERYLREQTTVQRRS